MRHPPDYAADTTNRAVIAAATATARRNFDRVTRKRPCLICGREKFCVTIDGRLQLCTKVQGGSVKASGDGSGWIHVLRDDPHRWQPRSEPRKEAPAPDLRPVILAAQQNTLPNVIAWHAGELGLPTDAGVDALRRLGAHTPRYDADAVLRLSPRDGEDSARLRAQLDWLDREAGGWIAVPMHSRGRIVGVRLRHVEGRKLALVGGREGLFLASDLRPGLDTLCIAEGLSDSAALLSIGIEAIGRPSCTGAVDETLRLMMVFKPLRVAVIADRDESGIRGAAALAKQIATIIDDTRCVLPPRGTKDVRAWITTGATANDILVAVEGGRRV